ncbi:diguanylate cyclase [Magnetococcus marinus MC-1]|uniref:diguanylate cyclase n=1 Tax=Magnetococcus marinus (strain ATCC BAA-1437 / JCM 17883 / MC-1) TaxID=156889 RepID=A0LA76_MAGMM|nr:GGDEF domain-containing protein [Magnetococcus marinus]ABK44869.1 diguanylate cyclase [Magnetococcus marinus MC-1]
MMNALDVDLGKQEDGGGLPSSDPAKPPPARTVSNTDTVRSLMRPTTMIHAEVRANEVAELFQRDPLLRIVPVVDDVHRPIGAVHRNRFMAIFLSQFGHDLYGRKPIHRLMCDEPLILEQSVTLQEASRIITDSSLVRDEHDFVITEGGQCVGAGFLLDLLKKITELQINYARYANPLTLLPGNVPICEEIDACLEEHKPFIVCYFDLDNFKPFNDAYGYEMGDQVIRKVAELLTQHVDSRRDFVGHVGGDDFIVLFRSEDWQTRTETMLREFEVYAPIWYSPEDREKGGIVSRDRRGTERFFGIVSLSVGAVEPVRGACKSHHDVASMAAHAKKMAKQTEGNSLFIDRRHQPC